MCFDPTLNMFPFYPGMKDDSGNPRTYDIDSREPAAIHFDFIDHEDRKMANANRLLQDKANLEMQIHKNGTLSEYSLATERLQARLAKLNQQLKDTPDSFKNAVLTYWQAKQEKLERRAKTA